MQQSGQDYWVPVDMELTGTRQGTHRDSCQILYETDDSNSDAVDLRGYGLLGLIVPALDQGSNLQFAVADTEDGTYRAVYGAGGVAVTITLAGGVAAISTAALAPLAAYRWVKIHATVKQTADAIFIWLLKG